MADRYHEIAAILCQSIVSYPGDKNLKKTR